MTDTTCTESEQKAADLLGIAVSLAIRHNFKHPHKPIQFWGPTPRAVEFNLPMIAVEVVRIDLEESKRCTELIEALIIEINQLAG